MFLKLDFFFLFSPGDHHRDGAVVSAPVMYISAKMLTGDLLFKQSWACDIFVNVATSDKATTYYVLIKALDIF